MPSSSKSEVERKFLALDVPDGLTGPSGVSIDQGYLAIDEESEVRLRRAGDRFTLTVKNGHGESRRETEVDLDQATFDELWADTVGHRVEKVRRKIDLDGRLVAELDEYSGGLEGVRVVEVEFESEGAARNFEPPAWFGRELTGDRAWANQSLAASGAPEKRLEFRLRPGEEAATGVCRVITARASQAAAEVRSAGASADSAGHVHEARKSLKKVRSALRLLRGVIPDDERSEANRACRDASAHLSGARDAEVKLGTLEKVTVGESDLDGAGDWRGELETEAAGHRGDITPEGLAEVARSIDAVARCFRGRELVGQDEAVAGNAGRGYRRGRKAMKKARSSDEVEAFHDWRKRAKDLRYQLEILEPELPEMFSQTRKGAEELADLLGDLHDLDVLKADLEGRDLETEDARLLAKAIDGFRAKEVRDCLDLGAEVYSVKPGKFTNRLGEALSGGA